MITSNSISSTIQTKFNLSSNLYKSSLIPSFQTSLNFNNKHHINLSISIKTAHNLLPKATIATNELYTPLIIQETLYDLLGIPKNGTLLEIKRAYKQMALKYHPDVSPPERADEYSMRFIRVQEAYETLSDPESRSMYDSSMAKGSRFDVRSGEKARWKELWHVQVAELKRMREDRDGRMSWAARIREQNSEPCAHGSSEPDQ
ncbi:chaperone protein dnaJ 20, chloroplastic-like [Rutidosis leptorrhynchoides]|uniref:chaperone protein dnaJ 20, chloroplastic-like n=1 Tax=Rutidosis leptorrhynchoides TaxID=125765 RepID=UPI003A9995EC